MLDSYLWQSRITISKDGKSADAAKLMAVMGLGVKCGQQVKRLPALERTDQSWGTEGGMGAGYGAITDRAAG